MKKVYFPNLNGLRFIAAFGVIIHHIEQYKFLLHEPNRWHIPFFEMIGDLFVILFFVLSGFLITYLLLDEQLKTQGINIRSFYMRRVLRIWPLYYLIVSLGLFVLPTISVFYLPGLTEAVPYGFAQKALLLFLILPNLVVTPLPAVYQVWSIGVEEQFYLIWPLLFKKIANPFLICLVVLVGYFIVKFALLPFVNELSGHASWAVTAIRIWNKFSVDCMAIGGIVAIILHRRQESVLRWMFNPFVQAVTLFICGIMIAYGIEPPYVGYECYAVMFALIIVNLAANPRSLLNLEFPVLNYLGKISYGLYMYHVIAIAIAHYLSKRWLESSDIALYSLTFVLTISIAAASYTFFEKRFILAKDRFLLTKKDEHVPVGSVTVAS